MAELTQEQWRAINDMTLHIHTTADAGDMRRAFMAGLQRIISHEKSFFDLCSCSDRRFLFFDPVSVNMEESELAAYYRQYQFLDYVAWIFTAEQPVIYSDSSIVCDEVREKSAIYQGWMKPMGVYYSMGSTLVDNGKMYGSITLFRSRESGDFTDWEMEILRILNLHLSRRFGLLYPNGMKAGSEETGGLMERYRLTEREHEIMQLISAGMSNLEIGNRLYISENTVKKHVNNLYRKLNINSRRQLMKVIYSHVSMLVDTTAV